MTNEKYLKIKTHLLELMREFEDVSEEEQQNITQAFQTVQEKLAQISMGMNQYMKNKAN